MALDTYDGLKTSIANFLNRSDADTIATIPDFIALAEGQMARRFAGRARQGLPSPRRLMKRSDTSVATSDEYIPVPDDMMGPLQFLLTNADGDSIELDYLDREVFMDVKTRGLYPGYTFTQPASGPPRYYTVVGGELQILPVADQAYTGELTYISRTAALSSTNQTNWILADYPDAYLYGALVQSAPYLKDDARLTVWGTLFTAAIDDICNADPMPSDKSILRSDIALIQTFTRNGARYNVNTDTP